MGNKLQELTEKLYAEGLEKGKSDADRMVADAKAESVKIVEDARALAAHIQKQAEDRAADTMKNSMTEITLAGKQAVSTLKTQIAQLVVAKSTSEAVKSAAANADFIREMLLSVAKNWNGAESHTSLEALLPAAERAKLESAMTASAKQLLDAGVEVGYSEEVKNGFKVGAKNGGYYISFTDESFEALLQQYLRDKVSQMLFGK